MVPDMSFFIPLITINVYFWEYYDCPYYMNLKLLTTQQAYFISMP